MHDCYAVAVKMTRTTDIVSWTLLTSLDNVVALIIRCENYFVTLIFVAIEGYENILTTKISQYLVHCKSSLKVAGS